jgi:hypothetical protein
MLLIKLRVLYGIVYPGVPGLVIVDQLVTANPRREQDSLGVKGAGDDALLYIFEEIPLEEIAVVVHLQTHCGRGWCSWVMCGQDILQSLIVCEKLIIGRCLVLNQGTTRMSSLPRWDGIEYSYVVTAPRTKTVSLQQASGVPFLMH